MLERRKWRKVVEVETESAGKKVKSKKRREPERVETEAEKKTAGGSAYRSTGRSPSEVLLR